MDFAYLLQVLGPPGQGLLFLACVAVATVAQTLTGFAFGLVLLGLVACFHLASVADAANASMVLNLVNTATYFAGHREPPPWRLMRPAVLASLPGVVIGVLLLAWLSGNAVDVLRGLLGVTIVGCAIVLLLRRARNAQVSGPAAFGVAGAVSGLLGGMFGTSGPPMVYHMYRQPLEAETVRRGLLMIFAINSAMRLVMVVATGGLSLRAALLALLAFPLVVGVTRWTQRHPPALSAGTLRGIVAGLLVLAGSSLLLGSLA